MRTLHSHELQASHSWIQDLLRGSRMCAFVPSIPRSFETHASIIVKSLASTCQCWGQGLAPLWKTCAKTLDLLNIALSCADPKQFREKWVVFMTVWLCRHNSQRHSRSGKKWIESQTKNYKWWTMNNEGQNGATIIVPRLLTCWLALLTASDCALKEDTHSSVYYAEINLIALIPNAASLEENSVFEYELI